LEQLRQPSVLTEAAESAEIAEPVELVLMVLMVLMLLMVVILPEVDQPSRVVAGPQQPQGVRAGRAARGRPLRRRLRLLAPRRVDGHLDSSRAGREQEEQEEREVCGQERHGACADCHVSNLSRSATDLVLTV
jgi:hypothetical protein